MFRRRSRASTPIFLVGLSLIASGIGWEWAPLWIAGLVVFAVGLLLLARQKRRNAIWRG